LLDSLLQEISDFRPAMADISKEELKKEIEEILKDADLDNTSAKKVRIQLQEKLDCDLTERKKEVDDLVMEVIDEQTQDEEDGDDEEDEDDEEEEEDSEDEKPKKKKVAPKPKKVAAKPKKKASADSDSGSGSEYNPGGGSDDEEEEVPSDGGGSDYEPDEPVKVGRGAKSKKKAAKRDSDGDSSGEEWGGKKKGSKGRKKKNSSDDEDSDYEKPKAKKGRKGGGNGYTAPVKLSEELADIVGGDEMPRHEVVKRMWAYIKDNKLQDPKNKQFIKCDEKLSKVIPTKKFRGFGMVKYLKEHMNVE